MRTTPSEIDKVRANMIEPYWKYLDKCFNLEYLNDERQSKLRIPQIGEGITELEKHAQTLDQQSREAIFTVFNWEMAGLIMRCRMEATTFMPTKRQIGILQ